MKVRFSICGLSPFELEMESVPRVGEEVRFEHGNYANHGTCVVESVRL